MFVSLLCHSKGHKRNTTGYNPEIFQSLIGHERKQMLVANKWPVKKGEEDAQQSLRESRASSTQAPPSPLACCEPGQVTDAL